MNTQDKHNSYQMGNKTAINVYRMNIQSMCQDRPIHTGYNQVHSSNGICVGLDTNSIINTHEIGQVNSYDSSRKVKSSLDN